VIAAVNISVATFLLMGAVQMIWGLIRGINFIVFLALINLQYPPNAESFLSGTMEIATIDIYDG